MIANAHIASDNSFVWVTNADEKPMGSRVRPSYYHVGPPKPSEWRTAKSLRESGIIGLYVRAKIVSQAMIRLDMIADQAKDLDKTFA